MALPIDPTEREPKGDHNRRLSLGMDRDQFAAAAGITVEELQEYENTWPDHEFSPMIAERVGEALDRLENVLPNSEAAGIRHIQEVAENRVPEPIPPTADEIVEKSIRDTAYNMWESDGRPVGRDEEYLARAREIVLGQDELDEEFEEELAFEPDSSFSPEPMPSPSAEVAEKAAEASRKIGLQRPFKKGDEDSVSGGFNQKR